MTEWKDIHPDLTNQLQWEWYNRKFTPEQTQEWINIGLKPTDFLFSVYLRDILSCEPEEVLNFGDLETLKEQYGEYLKRQVANLEEEDETQTLANAIKLSLGISSPDDLKLSDQELEKYLLEKRLELKNYFPFNIQELTTKKLCDSFKNVAYNGRAITESLSEDLTKLAIENGWDSRETFSGKSIKKDFLILNKENGSSPSRWETNDLDKKIANGEELYILFEKDDNWVDWKGRINEDIVETSVVNVRIKPSLYLRDKKDTLGLLRKKEFECQSVSCQKEKIANQDYCLYHQTCLAKLGEKKNIPNIQEIDTFPTWFNGNCGTLINKDSDLDTVYPFRLWLVIYEPADESRKIDEYWTPMPLWRHKSLTGAQKQASETKNELCKDDILVSPLASVYWKADKYTTFADLVGEHQVRTIDLPCEFRTSVVEARYWGQGRWGPPHGADFYETHTTYYPNKNPEGFLKPLDVIWIRKIAFPEIRYCHVGVYLGSDKVCHFSSPESKTRGNRKTIITNWDKFIEGWDDGKVFGYHPILPFKHYKLIAQQIDWAEANEHGKGRYCLPNNNCEHHANSLVFGIDYSKQIWNERSRTFWGKQDCKFCKSCEKKIVNDGKGKTVKLTDEIKETNNELGKRTGYWYKEIKTQYEAKTMVPPCKVM